MDQLSWLLIWKLEQIAKRNVLDAIHLSYAIHKYFPEKDIADHKKFLAVFGDLYLFIPENKILKLLMDNGYMNAGEIRKAGMKGMKKIEGLGRLTATKVVNAVNGREYQAHAIYAEMEAKHQAWLEKERILEESGYYDYGGD